MKSVFFTVGTTSFDDLIAAVTSPEATQVLQDLGYRKLVLQVGRGKECPDPFSTAALTLEVFRFKSSLSEDVKKADLQTVNISTSELSHFPRGRKSPSAVPTPPPALTQRTNNQRSFEPRPSLTFCAERIGDRGFLLHGPANQETARNPSFCDVAARLHLHWLVLVTPPVCGGGGDRRSSSVSPDLFTPRARLPSGG
ncbi:putative bifunctional UDP-N-acetylglucosamine transferase and deubiquitinase ALG13 [Crotalus adamanteus]|uniref:UDP-N-acetylglucosamine transferase subunit ALG13 n=1 Tax=Crotalus adamanteus TaxID=8729 RepID=A0AAW1BWB0_CROAD